MPSIGISVYPDDSDDPEELRRILVQARTDPAVRLELSADERRDIDQRWAFAFAALGYPRAASTVTTSKS